MTLKRLESYIPGVKLAKKTVKKGTDWVTGKGKDAVTSAASSVTRVASKGARVGIRAALKGLASIPFLGIKKGK